VLVLLLLFVLIGVANVEFDAGCLRIAEEGLGDRLEASFVRPRTSLVLETLDRKPVSLVISGEATRRNLSFGSGVPEGW